MSVCVVQILGELCREERGRGGSRWNGREKRDTGNTGIREVRLPG